MLTQRWQVTPGFSLCDAVQEGKVWSITDQILADVVDALHSANWQRQQKPNAQKPKRYPRPWETKNDKKLGSDPIAIADFDNWWNSQDAG